MVSTVYELWRLVLFKVQFLSIFTQPIQKLQCSWEVGFWYIYIKKDLSPKMRIYHDAIIEI